MPDTHQAAVMSIARLTGHVGLVLLIVLGFTVPAMAISPGPAFSPVVSGSQTVHDIGNTTSNNTSVNVSVGPQLSTIISVSSDDVSTDFENSAFEASYDDNHGDEGKAVAIAKRASVLEHRAARIRQAYEQATQAFEAGELSRTAYARELAVLNAHARNLLKSLELLRSRASSVSALELDAAGINQSAINASIDRLNAVNGTGLTELSKQFTAESDGKLSISTHDGVSIEVEHEDGHLSRQVHREGDTNRHFTISQADALRTARAALPTPGHAQWSLNEGQVEQGDGVYKFHFALANTTNLTGNAEVRVDGSSGQVVKLELEMHRPAPDGQRDASESDAGDEEHHGDREAPHHELAVVVANGTPAPNATIAVQVLANETPVSNATVAVNEHVIGQTDANGSIVLTLPDAHEAVVRARSDRSRGILKFEFEHTRDRSELYQKLHVRPTLDNSTVTVGVHFGEQAVENVTVYANGHRVGRTDQDGIVRFELDPNATRTLKLTLVKGRFHVSYAYLITNGQLVTADGEHESGDHHQNETEDQHSGSGDQASDSSTPDQPQAFDGHLALSITDGQPAPGANITVTVTGDGEPMANVTVAIGDHVIGTTDAHGQIEVTIPRTSEVTLKARKGDAEGELKLDFGHEED